MYFLVYIIAKMCFGDNRAKKQFSQSKFMQYAQPAPAKAGAG
jgi:hypothetical protein